MAISDDAERSGTQSIERAVALLREISTRGQFGWQMSDLAERCHLGKSTAHRILACLVRERLVRQRSSDRHYLPGPLLFELGLSLPALGGLQHAARKRIAELAKRTSGVSFLLLRSGDDFVCAARAGNRDLKSLTISPGTRRPLVSSVGGVAMLLALPIPEARLIVRRNFATLAESGMSKARMQGMRLMLEHTKSAGFAVNAGYLVAGFNAFGLAVSDANEAPIAAITVVGPSATLPIGRFSEIRRLLQAAVDDLKIEIP